MIRTHMDMSTTNMIMNACTDTGHTISRYAQTIRWIECLLIEYIRTWIQIHVSPRIMRRLGHKHPQMYEMACETCSDTTKTHRFGYNEDITSPNILVHVYEWRHHWYTDMWIQRSLTHTEYANEQTRSRQTSPWSVDLATTTWLQ